VARDEPLGLELEAERLGRVEGRCPFHDVSVGEIPLETGRRAKLPCRYVVEKTRPRALERQIRPHDNLITFSRRCNANSKILC
jgi:hypothetical protein